MKTTTITRWMGVEPPTIIPDTLRWSSPRAWPIWRWLGTAIALIGLFVLIAWVGPLLRLADPTAVVDIGALSLVLLAVVAPLELWIGVARKPIFVAPVK